MNHLLLVSGIFLNRDKPFDTPQSTTRKEKAGDEFCKFDLFCVFKEQLLVHWKLAHQAYSF